MLLKKTLLAAVLLLSISSTFSESSFKPVKNTLVEPKPYHLQLQTYLDSDTALNKLENLILHSKKHVFFVVSGFKSVAITRALINAQKKGVKIGFIVGSNNKPNEKVNYTSLTPLVNARITVGINKKFENMHHQFIIIDDKIVTTNINFENKNDKKSTDKFLVLDNSGEIAKVFIELFDTLSKESEQLKPNL